MIQRRNKKEMKQFEKRKKKEILKSQYMLLSRLKQDCKYYLGNGGRCAKHLWASDEKAQIEKMRELYNSFPIGKKPKWISKREIKNYAVQMNIEESFFEKLKRKFK